MYIQNSTSVIDAKRGCPRCHNLEATMHWVREGDDKFIIVDDHKAADGSLCSESGAIW